MARKITAYDQRRIERRDTLWPESKDAIYNRKEENGFCTIPRSLGMIATLIRHMSKNDASRVYVDLWMRQRDDGFVDIEDAQEMASAVGLKGTRAQKSWREKLDVLQKHGFIRIREKGHQKYKYILLLHPHDVVQKIRHDDPRKVPEWWWSIFTTRMEDVKAKLRWTPTPAAVEEEDDLPF